jgi:hypothetical protein
VLVSLERNPTPYVIGREKVYERGAPFTGEIWVTNDFLQPIEQAQVSWEIVSVDTGEVVGKNGLTATLTADSAHEVDRIEWSIPESARPGTYRVAMKVLAPDGRTLSANATDITVR